VRKEAAGQQGPAGPQGERGPYGPAGPPGALRHVEGPGDAIACNEGEVLVAAICKEGPATVQGAAAGAKCGTATGIIGLCMRKWPAHIGIGQGLRLLLLILGKE
jgi:hypothetical protein